VTMRVSPATTWETLLRERVNNCSPGSVGMSQSPLFVFRNNRRYRKSAALVFKLRLRQNFRRKQSYFRGRYLVGYHRMWFPTDDKNRVYGIASGDAGC
jgi:hypothetical protein